MVEDKSEDSPKQTVGGIAGALVRYAPTEPPLDTFDTARMNALKEYAQLEYQLCRLFMTLLESEPAVASAIFYNIAAARTRHVIIESLLDIRHQHKFTKSWPRLEGWLRRCDAARNHIVHWGQDERVLIIP